MWTLKISKEALKFSAAHFTIFNASRAERLHGHNYYVEMFLRGSSLDSQGLLVELSKPKEILKSLLCSLDEKVLLPTQSSHLKITEDQSNHQVCFQNKRYSFPKEDVELLPLNNISLEQLSWFLSEQIKTELLALPIESCTLSVTETRGQSGSFCLSLQKERKAP